MANDSIELLGEETIKVLKKSHIAIFGLGNVGSEAALALARHFINTFSLFDYAKIEQKDLALNPSANLETLGKLKTEAMLNQILAINKDALVHSYSLKIDDEFLKTIDFKQFDYIVDCFDDIKSKVAVITQAKIYGKKVISCWTTSNKFANSHLQIKDISAIPENKKLKEELQKNEISNLDVLVAPKELDDSKPFFFAPNIAGLLIANHIITTIHDLVLEKRIHLVLEGGGMKGVYTTGVIDFFLEKNLEFNAVYGVSAGACAATSLLSKQVGRSYHAMVDYVGDPRYASKRSLTKTGNYFNKDFIYNQLPNKLIPFDYVEALNNPCKLYATVTNVKTGKAEYHMCSDYHHDIEYVCASSSLPLLAEIQKLDGNEYLDGGIADSIPYFEAKRNALKCVVVLTKPKGYLCQKQNPILFSAMKLKYHKYPKFLKAIERRHIVYNQTLKALENDQNTFVIRPSKPLEVDRLETNKAKLEELYQLGYNDAKDLYAELCNFMK